MTIPNILNDDRVWNNVKPLKNEINYTPQITSVYGSNSCQRCEWRTAIWLLQQLIWLTGSQFSLAKGFIGPTVPKKQAIFRRNFTPTCRKVASKNMENPPDICRELLVFCSDVSPRSFLSPGSTWQRLNSTSFRSQWDLSAWPWRFCTFRQFHSVLALHEMRHVRDFARPFLIKIW